jgi:septum formation protein
MLSKFIGNLEIISSPYIEKIDPNGNPAIEVMRAALMKGLTVKQLCDENALIISADTIVHHQTILGKPTSPSHAFEMLTELSGTWHEVYTGFSIIDCSSDKKLVDYVKTQVKFNVLDKSLIEWYIQSGEPLDKAGAYGIQDLGAVLVEEIRGDYFNVVGFPIATVSRLLEMHFDYRFFEGDANDQRPPGRGTS